MRAPSAGVVELWAVRCACALAALWLVASIWFPFGWDQSMFAAAGDVVMRGGMPYRDAWDVKGPVAFYGFALAQALFGRGMWGIRVLDVLLLVPSCLALRAVVARISTPTAGTWSAALLVLWFASLSWFHASQPDGWVAMLVTIGVWDLTRGARPPSVARCVRFGLLVGCCALVKPFYAAFLAVPAPLLFCDAPGARRSGLVRLAACAAASAVLPALTLAWFAHRDALPALIDVHVRYTFGARLASTSLGLAHRADGVTRFLLEGSAGIVLAAAVAGVVSLRRETRPERLALATWLGVEALCVVIQNKFWHYHWLPAFPPFIALAGAALGCAGIATTAVRSAGAGDGGEDTPPSPARTLVAGVVVAALAAASLGPIRDVGRWLRYMTGRSTEDEYLATFRRDNYVALDVLRTARHVEARTSPTDTVEVWGNEGGIAFLANRSCPSRFVYGMPLSVPSPFRAAYRAEHMAALVSSPPAYVIVGQPFQGFDKQAGLVAFPEFQAFLASRYRIETSFGYLDLYRLNP